MRLLSQYKTILELVDADVSRLQVGVLATVEHTNEAGPETGKWVAETTQVCSVSPFPSRT